MMNFTSCLRLWPEILRCRSYYTLHYSRRGLVSSFYFVLLYCILSPLSVTLFAIKHFDVYDAVEKSWNEVDSVVVKHFPKRLKKHK